MALIKRRSLSTVFFWFVCRCSALSLGNSLGTTIIIITKWCGWCAFSVRLQISAEKLLPCIFKLVFVSFSFSPFSLSLSLSLAVAHCLFEFPCYEINMWCKRFCFIRYVHLLLCQCVHNNNESINPFLVDVSSRSINDTHCN